MSHDFRRFNVGRNFRSTFRYYPERFIISRSFNRNYRRRIADLERFFENSGLNIFPFPRPGAEESEEEEKEEVEETVPNVLKLEEIDLRVYKNAREHECSEYELTSTTDNNNRRKTPQAVVRRGAPFTISLRFNRPYEKETDKVSLQFAVGPQPKVVKNTLVRVPLSDTANDKEEWSAVIKSVDGYEVMVEVHTPPTLIIGIWRLRCLIAVEGNKVVQSDPNNIYIIFNPFSKDDAVYMEGSNERKEYVMNEYGKIYVGTSKQIHPRSWNFAQFQGNILDCAMYLLDRGDMPYTHRNDPVRICRKMSAMVNSSDDSGVICGNWSGNYQGGQSPLHWLGSEAILEQFYKTKKSVKYGQCWVFSGVLTTVLRTLGIPARSITNFSSAHDTDSSITIDTFYDSEGQAEDSMNDDSIWNFHVWNEAFMARPDLPGGYGGWQICDSTPQETSGGIYCCGPCPLKAIKMGDMNAQFDAPFIFAEVNADKVYWVKSYNGDYKSIVSNEGIGQHISTKQVLKPERNDVTKDYKYEEGTGAERAAVMRAVSSGNSRRNVYDQGPKDMVFDLDVDMATQMGSDFSVKLKMTNNSSETRTVGGTLAATSVFYTGVMSGKIKSQRIKEQVKPGTTEVVNLEVKYEDYDRKLEDHNGIHLTAMVMVNETQQVQALEEDFRLRKPDVTIKAPNSAKINEPFDIEVSFNNPLKVTLTECFLAIEGPGLQTPLSLPQKNVGAHETFHTTHRLTPRRTGSRTIFVNFNCTQIEGVTEEHFINISD